MRLFHLSDDPAINLFVPRPVRMSVERPPGLDWLNGSLVWATDEAHQVMYLFPRDCPRILLWPTPQTTAEDYRSFWQGSAYKKLAYIEAAWVGRVETSTIYRYDVPPADFEDLAQVGMWVTKESVKPLSVVTLEHLPDELETHSVELRVVNSLVPFKNVWRTSLHASGIRLRNAPGWGKPGWTHSKQGRKVQITDPSRS